MTGTPTTEGGAALTLSGVRAGWGRTLVLEGIDLALAAESSLVLLGRNGVGKSTLLATCMGHTTLHGGTIMLDGAPIARLPPHARARRGIGYVPQSREIFPSLTVAENLAVAARPGPWTLERIYALFPSIAARRARLGNEISGGEQQMLAIGRALAGNPRLLLMDEPLEGLAPIVVESLVGTLAQLIRERTMTIVLVEQRARIALELAERAMVLDRGRIAWSGASAELLAAPERLGALILGN
jgi:branched-chain amino acid transport system ATP-binding protein